MCSQTQVGVAQTPSSILCYQSYRLFTQHRFIINVWVGVLLAAYGVCYYYYLVVVVDSKSVVVIVVASVLAKGRLFFET